MKREYGGGRQRQLGTDSHRPWKFSDFILRTVKSHWWHFSKKTSWGGHCGTAEDGVNAKASLRVSVWWYKGREGRLADDIGVSSLSEGEDAISINGKGSIQSYFGDKIHFTGSFKNSIICPNLPLSHPPPLATSSTKTVGIISKALWALFPSFHIRQHNSVSSAYNLSLKSWVW